jgi:hypothetical protein
MVIAKAWKVALKTSSTIQMLLLIGRQIGVSGETAIVE